MLVKIHQRIDKKNEGEHAKSKDNFTKKASKE